MARTKMNETLQQARAEYEKLIYQIGDLVLKKHPARRLLIPPIREQAAKVLEQIAKLEQQAGQR